MDAMHGDVTWDQCNTARGTRVCAIAVASGEAHVLCGKAKHQNAQLPRGNGETVSLKLKRKANIRKPYLHNFSNLA